MTTPDLAAVQAEMRTAMVALASATRRWRLVRIQSLRAWMRAVVARRGIAVWAIALIVGSAITATFATLDIFVFEGGPASIFCIIFISYLVSGGCCFWLLRDFPGESEENRAASRGKELAAAVASRVACAAAVAAASNALNVARIRLAQAEGVLASESHRRLAEQQRLLAIDPGRLYPDEFERHAAAIFRHLGFSVEVRGQSGDQGVDIIACRGALRVAIQAKRHIGSVGNGAVQEVYAGMTHHRCHRCVVITTGSFTSGAIDLAKSTGCILVGPRETPALVRGEIRIA